MKYAWERLRWARQNAGYASASEFARAEGLGEATYRHHENGTRGLDVEKARRYGAALGVSWYWLLTGEQMPSEIPQARLFGTVGAGEKIITHDNHGPHEWIEAPPGLQNAAAVNVRGESMLPAYRPGDLLFFSLDINGPRIPDDALGHDCAVQLHDGTVYVKRLARGSKARRYTLRSYAADDIENVVVDWAQPIRWIKRA